MPENNPAADNINYATLSGVDSADFDEYLFEDVQLIARLIGVGKIDPFQD